jgi:diguanylate cyclase (GGDEF)-like protein
MSKPGFRKTRPAGRPARVGEEGDHFLSSSLFSQAQILHLMKSEFARARRHGVPVACVLIQVDRLGQLVDLHGVDLRFAVRSALTRIVQEKTRGADLLGAINDERYMLVLPHTSLAQARVVAERLRTTFADVEVTVAGKGLAPTLSLGFTASEDQHTLFFDTMVGQAEAALEWAMSHGGNQIVSFAETQLLDDGGAPGGDAPEDRAPR